jgi:hypothetical protein
MKLTRQEILKLSVALMHLGLLIDLVGAALFFLLGQLVRRWEIVGAVDAEPLRMLGYTLLAVSASEIVMVFILRRRWINSRSNQLRAIRDRQVLGRQLKLMFAMLYLVALTPALYGFLYYILGGSERMFVIMLVTTLLGYMVIRVRPDDIEDAIGDFDFEDPG